MPGTSRDRGSDIDAGDGASDLTVRDLVATPHLHLHAVAGEAGLGRRVTWTHVSELPEPASWLDGGELLISAGLNLKPDGAGQARLIRQLDERRAAGLVIGTKGPPLTPKALATADELAFPLLSVQFEVPFVSISRFVASANQDAAQHRLLMHIRVFDLLRPRAAGQITTAQLIEQLEELSKYRLAVVSPAGRLLIPASTTPPPETLAAVASLRPGHHRVPGGYAVPLPLPPGDDRLAAHLVTWESGDGPPEGLSTIRHIATILALELVNVYRERELRRREGAELLAAVLMERLTPGEAGQRLAALDLPADEPVVLVVVAQGGTAAIEDEVLDHELHVRGVPHAMLRQEERVLLLLPSETPGLDEVAEGLDLRLGISRSLGSVTSMAMARREALWALERAHARSGSARVVRYRDAETGDFWLPTDLPALRQLVDSTLGAIIAYDADRKGALLESLETFFACRRQMAVAADRLHVHKHTLAYRLKRIEELTNRDLGDVQDMSELWMALRAREILA
jgi:purine catabolism regulator